MRRLQGTPRQADKAVRFISPAATRHPSSCCNAADAQRVRQPT